MSMNNYGGFVIHVKDEAILKIAPFEFGKLVGIYDRIQMNWKDQRGAWGEYFKNELEEYISESIDISLEEDEFNALIDEIYQAWIELAQAFKNTTGATLETVFMNTDDTEWHGQLDEGVNFCIPFNEVYVKSLTAKRIEHMSGEKLEIETFSEWG